MMPIIYIMTTQEVGRAALFEGPGRAFRLASFPVPAPEPGAAVIRISRANLCGSDVHAWLGHFDIRKLGATFPTILGHEACGAIAALGEGLTTDSVGRPLAVGDRVVFAYFIACGRCLSCLRGATHACPNRWMAMADCADRPPHFIGTFADYFYIRPGMTILRAPDNVPDAVLAGANCALAQVIFGIDEAGLAPDDTVVVQGAGGLGLFATAIAHERGAGRVIVVDAVPERLELAKEFGADVIISTAELGTPRDRVRRVRELTDGWGADLVIEVAGVADAVAEGLSFLAPTGRYLVMGSVAAGQSVSIEPARLILSNARMLGVSWYRPMALHRAMEFLARNVERLPLDRLSGTAYPLEQIDDAFRDAAERRVARPALEMV